MSSQESKIELIDGITSRKLKFVFEETRKIEQNLLLKESEINKRQ